MIFCRKNHQKKIPQFLDGLPVEILDIKPDGQKIGDGILKFIEENAGHTSNEPGKIASPLQQLTGGHFQFLKLHAQNLLKPFLEPHAWPLEDGNQEKDRFLCAVENFDRKRLYVLAVCVKPISTDQICYDTFSLVPWTKVFDFDGDTDGTGFLSILRKSLPKSRLDVLRQEQAPSEIKDKIVNWTVITECGDRVAKRQLKKHILSLSKFRSGRKPATMVILWYHNHVNDELEENVRDFISNMEGSFGNRSIKIVLCLSQEIQDGGKMSKISKQNVDKTIIAPLNNICEWIGSVKDNLTPVDHDIESNQLPRSELEGDTEDSSSCKLDQEILAWLTVDLHVLTLSFFQKPMSKLDNEKVKAQGIDFLMGGDLTWDVLKYGEFVVNRAKFKVIKQRIQELIDNRETGIVTLHHAPGSGGSTLGRQLLWSFRSNVPCLALDKRIELGDDFKEKLVYILERSGLPVLLLLDGRSSQEAKNIMSLFQDESIVILQVERNYDPLDQQDNKQNFHLHDRVSPSEASDFEMTFRQSGTAGIKKSLTKLTQSILSGNHHSVFEYGLTAFNSDFRAIGKYVENHLRIGEKKEVWHDVVAMLSLTNYYGNRDLPAEFFANILEICESETVSLENDIPELGKQLIRECTGGEEWRISHYLVAKEILEQYLGGVPSDKNTSQLTPIACQSLMKLACHFIECMKQHERFGDKLQSSFIDILTNVFIVRNGKYIGDMPGRKSTFSRLITDIGNKEEQRKLFKLLVERFPYNAEFHAHFGRFVAKKFLDPAYHSEAEDALNKAIKIRVETLNMNSSNENMPTDDEQLQRVRNMLGFAYFDILRYMLQNRKHTDASVNIGKLKQAKEKALAAIKVFADSRNIFCSGVIRFHDYLGDIKVRLLITKYCFYHNKHNLMTISSPEHPLHFLWDFILDTFAETEYLFEQCIEVSENRGKGQLQFQSELEDYLSCFAVDQQRLKNFVNRMDSDSSLTSKRCRAALVRLSCRSDDKNQHIEVIQRLPKYRHSEYIRLLQDVINDKDSWKIKISPYMEDWMKISRSPTHPTSLHSAKFYADVWDSRNERGSFASLYRYIIQYVMTLLDNSEDNRSELDKCTERLNECQRFFRSNIARKPIEYIKEVVNGDANLSVLRNANEKDEPLCRFHGQIIDVKAWSGTIEMRGNRMELPFATKNRFMSYHAKSKQRVNFIIGFNAKRGAQAYDVRMTESRPEHCPYCRHIIKYANTGMVRCTNCDSLFEIK